MLRLPGEHGGDVLAPTYEHIPDCGSQTPSGASEQPASAACYRVVLPGGHHLDVLDVRAENGDRWIEARRIESTSPWVRSLDGRLRLTIQRRADGKHWCELRQARAKPAGWSNLVNASLSELDEGAGLDVAHELRAAGAAGVGTREDLLEDDGPRRRAMCVAFRADDEVTPVSAFVLTRVLPLVRTDQTSL